MIEVCWANQPWRVVVRCKLIEGMGIESGDETKEVSGAKSVPVFRSMLFGRCLPSKVPVQCVFIPPSYPLVYSFRSTSTFHARLEAASLPFRRSPTVPPGCSRKSLQIFMTNFALQMRFLGAVDRVSSRQRFRLPQRKTKSKQRRYHFTSVH